MELVEMLSCLRMRQQSNTIFAILTAKGICTSQNFNAYSVSLLCFMPSNQIRKPQTDIRDPNYADPRQGSHDPMDVQQTSPIEKHGMWFVERAFGMSARNGARIKRKIDTLVRTNFF